VPSIQSQAFERALRRSGIKRTFDKAFDSGRFHSGVVDAPPRLSMAGLVVERSRAGERNVFVLRPRDGGKGPRVLYLHGGGYVFGFNRFVWKFLGNLCRSTGCTVVAPDYPLAPRCSFRDAFDMVMPLHRDLSEARDGTGYVLMGDSAGGGFALALAQQARDEGVPPPRRIVLLSPWLDVSLENPDIPALEREDPVLSVAGLRRAAAAYAAGTDPHDPRLSPIHGSMASLPRISLFSSSKDLLVADARKLHAMLAAQGTDHDYVEAEGMVHDWILFPLPESAEASTRVADLVRT
jgi:acetyl esterase/lipase